MSYNYDRRPIVVGSGRQGRNFSENVIRNLVRWIDDYKDRAWRLYAYDQHDRGIPVAEYILTARGQDIYNLATPGGRFIIPTTNDISKLKRFLGKHEDLDWEPVKPRPKPPKTDKPFWRFWE